MNTFLNEKMASTEWQVFSNAFNALVRSRFEKFKELMRCIASRPLCIFDSTRNIGVSELNSWFFYMRILAFFALMAGSYMLRRSGLISSDAWDIAVFVMLSYLAFNFFWFAVSQKTRLSNLVLHAQLILDLIFFTAIIYYFGSSHDELAFIFILNIMSAAFISAFAASMSAITAVIIYLLLSYMIADFANTPHIIAFLVTVFAVALQLNFFISKSRKKDEDSSRLKDAFLGMAMHQIKNPLAAESLLLESVSGGEGGNNLAPEQLKVILRAKKVNDNIGQFIRDFSVILKTEEHLEKLEFEEVSPFKIIHDVVREIRINPLKKITIYCAFPDEIESERIRTVPSFFRQIFSNIISNAVLYSHYRGRVEVTAKKENGALIIQCRDNGIGIPDYEQANIFNPFYRGSNAKKKEEGTGLGLFIVKRFADLLGYTVTYQSSSEGTAFYVTIPV